MTCADVGFVVVLGGGGRQGQKPCPLEDLYLGSYVTCARTWARSLRTRQPRLVLSAYYGLVLADTLASPYTASFKEGGPRVVSSEQIRRQFQCLFPRADAHSRVRLLLIAGQSYESKLIRAIGDLILLDRPFYREAMERCGSAGMGYQMQMMNSFHGRLPAVDWSIPSPWRPSGPDGIELPPIELPEGFDMSHFEVPEIDLGDFELPEIDLGLFGEEEG